MNKFRIFNYSIVISFFCNITFAQEVSVEKNDPLSNKIQEWVERGYTGADSVRLARCGELPEINIARLTEDGVLDTNERRLIDEALALKAKTDEYNAIASSYDDKIKALMREIESGLVSLAVAQERLTRLREDSADVVRKREEQKEKLDLRIRQINGTLTEQKDSERTTTRPESK